MYVVGQAYYNSTRGDDMAIVKYDRFGLIPQQWNGGEAVYWNNDTVNGEDVATCVAVYEDGNDVFVHVGGFTEVGSGVYDYVALKLNGNDGTLDDQEWTNPSGVRLFDGEAGGNDKAWAIAVDADGNCFVAGHTQMAHETQTAIDFGVLRYSRTNNAGDDPYEGRSATLTFESPDLRSSMILPTAC